MAKTVPLVIDEDLRALVEQYADAHGLTLGQAVNALASDATKLTRGALRAMLKSACPDRRRQVH